MSAEAIRQLLFVFVRYAISNSGLLTVLIGAGFLTDDVNTVVEQVTVITVGAMMQFGPAIYAMIKRPSPKAMEAAKIVDRDLPKDAPVVIQTPAGEPNIIVPAKGATS
jgi:predicted sugar kinase